jgi:hypothetical protein
MVSIYSELSVGLCLEGDDLLERFGGYRRLFSAQRPDARAPRKHTQDLLRGFADCDNPGYPKRLINYH